jgi:CMP/dCMP kinase
MKKYITISREFGSGGRTIGQIVAKELGYSFYDKEIIDMTARESGLSPEFIEKTEQTISSTWLYNMMLGSSYAGLATGSIGQGGAPSVLPLADQVFNAQRKIILEAAAKGPCVIVGRCADTILSASDFIRRDAVFNVFIYADTNAKIKRAVSEYDIPENEAPRLIHQIDKHRANHYNTFTENTWGNRMNYDLMINSSLLGVEGTAKIIAEIAR